MLKPPLGRYFISFMPTLRNVPRNHRRKTSNVGIKEMKYRPKIGPGDFDTKTRQVLEVLVRWPQGQGDGDVRGREVIHPDLGRRILERITEQIEGVAKIETEGRLDGRNMVMVLAPDKRAKQSSEAKQLTEERHKVSSNGSAPAVATQVVPVRLRQARLCRGSWGSRPTTVWPSWI